MVRGGGRRRVLFCTGALRAATVAPRFHLQPNLCPERAKTSRILPCADRVPE